ncbi:MAG: D-alanyl-D-alanine carboxypeptidase [Firmicutes bacterium]|nr:D-alanyl-D-alanine carboxypeptidase [Bacillota bacterium]
MSILFATVFVLTLLAESDPNPFRLALSATAPGGSFDTPDLSAYSSIQVTADAAILIDASTGTVLYAKNAHQKRPPASTTKIMTAILALELGDLEEVVKVGRSATGVGGSQIWLEPNEELTLYQLLQGMMLKSGNDAAVAIAQHIAGSVKNFCALMNKRAKELGAFNTVFSNPNGLPEKTKPHYSTAYDLAMMARRGMQIPVFREIVRTKYEQIPWGDHDWQRRLKNTNRLLWYFEGADGVKTGTTRAAGNCLVASATRGGFQLIAVVLHSNNRWRDAAALLEYGFRNFRPFLAYAQGQPVKTVTVRGGTRGQVALVPHSEVSAVVPVSEWNRVQILLSYPEYLEAPFWSGEAAGRVRVVLGDEVLADEPLYTSEPVPRCTFWSILFGA